MDLQVEGEEEIVFDWSKDRCYDWHIPDAPLRAFRNYEGKVVAYASNDRNIPLIGDDLRSIATTCRPSFQGKKSPDPADHSDASWITATWTDDGQNVHALVHNEFHAAEHPGACRFRDGMSCWYNVITTASSQDGGLTFEAPREPIVVAGPLSTQDVGQGRHRGFFNPSNIVSHNGHLYVLIATTGGEGQEPGTCLFRTSNIADPTSWRGWDGSDFSVKGYDAYRPHDNEARACKAVARFPISPGSVTRHKGTGIFIATVLQGGAEKSPRSSLAYATSSDLINWSRLTIFYELPSMWSRSCKDSVRYAYASVLDPDSPSGNFDIIGDAVYVYMTRFTVENCRLGSKRDLVRFAVRIQS
jgi:hypothetical protein